MLRRCPVERWDHPLAVLPLSSLEGGGGGGGSLLTSPKGNTVKEKESTPPPTLTLLASVGWTDAHFRAPRAGSLPSLFSCVGECVSGGGVVCSQGGPPHETWTDFSSPLG